MTQSHIEQRDYGVYSSKMGKQQQDMLPSPQEVHHESQEPQLYNLMLKSIALQLKPMNDNSQITASALSELSLLAMDQLDSMVMELQRLSTLQRRKQIALGDVELWLRGFNLNPEDIDISLQQSNYIKEQYTSDCKKIQEETNKHQEVVDKLTEQGSEYNETPFQLFEQEQSSSMLLPPSTKIQKYLPSWLPEFPPDHTYRFTPQYNNPITDEVIIRQKTVEEGKKSEKALVNLIKNMQNDKNVNVKGQNSTEEEHLADQESFALYYRIALNNKQGKILLPIRSMTHVQKKFDVEQYAHQRIDLARRQVADYESKELQRLKNPLLNLTKLIVNNKQNKNKFQINKDVRHAFRRSFNRMIGKLPDLQERKINEIQLAKEQRDIKLQELKALQDKRHKERDLQNITSSNLETIFFDDKNSITGEVEDEDLALFGNLGSSDDELDLSLDVTNDDKLPTITTTPSFDITSPTKPIISEPENLPALAEHHVTIVEPTEQQDKVSVEEELVQENITTV